MANKDPGDLSFLSKNWLKAQREVTELDFNLMNQTMQSFKAPFNDLASSFNREWDNFRKTSLTLGDFQTSESPLFKLKEIQPPTPIAFKMEDFSISSLIPFFPAPEEVASWKPPPLAKREPFSVRKAVAKELYLDIDHYCKEIALKPARNEPKFPVDCKEIKEALQDWQKSRKGNWQYSLQEWEPLRRLRVSLMELESMAAASRTPKDFFENLKKIEFFENTKKTLVGYCTFDFFFQYC